MSFSTKYMSLVRRVLPSPLAIAIILTFITATLALIFTDSGNISPVQYISNAWSEGFWELLQFTMQMMVMLVLGHVIALSKVVARLIDWITSFCTTPLKAAGLVAVFSILMGYFNWGLGLIFGAILARKVAEHAAKIDLKINYPLIGSCGYLSILVWHGGLSGSAPLTIAKAGHSLESVIGVIPISETIFSMGNAVVFGLVLLLLPATAMLLAKSTQFKQVLVPPKNVEQPAKIIEAHEGAEKLDYLKWFGAFFGACILLIAAFRLFNLEDKLSYLNLDSINFMLFGIALLCHGSLGSFTSAAEDAVVGTSGILIQFPLYAGIMGIMKYTGLLALSADFMLQFSNAQSFPFFAYLSSSVVNILVPSGGGQWQVQGPILVEAAQRLGIPFQKVVMALAYGDQLTNMLQPFWALPLLGITGLKAKDILPYSTLFMLVAGTIYLAALYLF